VRITLYLTELKPWFYVLHKPPYHEREDMKDNEDCDSIMVVWGTRVMCTWGLIGKPEKNNNLQDLGADGMTMLKYVLTL
jgi:hypothetical protein